MALGMDSTHFSASSLIGFGSNTLPIASMIHLSVSEHAGGSGQQIPHPTVTHLSITQAEGAKFKFPPNKLQTVITIEPKVFCRNLAQINACTGLFYQVQKKKLKNSISEALSVDEGTYSIPSLTKVKLQTDF